MANFNIKLQPDSLLRKPDHTLTAAAILIYSHDQSKQLAIAPNYKLKLKACQPAGAGTSTHAYLQSQQLQNTAELYR